MSSILLTWIKEKEQWIQYDGYRNHAKPKNPKKWKQINFERKEGIFDEKKAFVTGATGFSGINLVKRLSKENWDITTYSLPGSNNQYWLIRGLKTLIKLLPRNYHSSFDFFRRRLSDAYPYNVNYQGGTKDKLKIQNDSMANDVFRKFLVDAFSAADNVMKQGAVFYIWHADSEGYNFRGACFDIEWQVRQCLIWNKSSLVMGRQDYQWKHEPCLYGWKSGSSHLWSSDRKRPCSILINQAGTRSTQL